jgi:hypothetical protein
VISYELYCQIQLYDKERGLSFAQIGRELNLDEETVAKWARQKTYSQRLKAQRKSKLDPYKPIIQRWLEQHPYSATQIFQRLRAEQAYTGGISILTDYVRRVRPVRAPAFLTLAFAPGECAQVDWGSSRLNGHRFNSPTALLLCHGALLQPVVLCRVYPGRSDRALPGCSPERLGVFWQSSGQNSHRQS